MTDSQESQTAERRWRLPRQLVPLSIIGFCGVAYWLSTQFERVPPILKRGMQPSDFPQLVIGLMVFLSVLLIFRDKPYTLERLSGLVLGSMAMLVGFGFVAEVDLFLGIGLFAGSLTVLWGERRVWVVLLVGVVIPMAVFFLFDGLFDIRFPRGILTNFWYG